MLGERAWPNGQDIGLVGDSQVTHLARDHLEAGFGTQEPATDLLDAPQRSRVVTDVDPHLDALVHERHRSRSITIVELLEERFHRVDCTHAAQCRGVDDRAPSGATESLEPAAGTTTAARATAAKSAAAAPGR